MSRLDNNRRILTILSEYIEKHPDLRFIQILWALNVVDHSDRFYEEPETTLEKINNELRKETTSNEQF